MCTLTTNKLLEFGISRQLEICSVHSTNSYSSCSTQVAVVQQLYCCQLGLTVIRACRFGAKLVYDGTFEQGGKVCCIERLTCGTSQFTCAVAEFDPWSCQVFTVLGSALTGGAALGQITPLLKDFTRAQIAGFRLFEVIDREPDMDVNEGTLARGVAALLFLSLPCRHCTT